jgi:DNA-binding Lrp family transcriptional regulator
MLNISVQGRDARAVAEDVGGIEEVASVVLLLGTPQISAMIHARDRTHLHELISGPISVVAGIAKIEADVMLNIWKYRSDLARFDL